MDNKEHFRPWEPERHESYYTLKSMSEKCRQSEEQCVQGLGIHWLAFLKGRLVGFCHFSNIVRGVFQACHLGYGVDSRHQGQGLMREVVQAGIQYMFDEQGLHRVMANYMPSNSRSEGLLKSLGFEREGFAKDYLKINGKWEDHILTAKRNIDL